jgi:hypothetical protein
MPPSAPISSYRSGWEKVACDFAVTFGDGLGFLTGYPDKPSHHFPKVKGLNLEQAVMGQIGNQS